MHDRSILEGEVVDCPVRECPHEIEVADDRQRSRARWEVETAAAGEAAGGFEEEEDGS